MGIALEVTSVNSWYKPKAMLNILKLFGMSYSTLYQYVNLC